MFRFAELVAKAGIDIGMPASACMEQMMFAR
jgi:hypothetical protein